MIGSKGRTFFVIVVKVLRKSKPKNVINDTKTLSKQVRTIYSILSVHVMAG